MALRTNGSLGKLVRPLLRRGRSILLLQHLNVFDDTLKRHEVVGRGAYQRTLYLDALVRAVEHLVQCILRQLLHRSFQRCLILLQQGGNLPENHAVLGFPQGCDGTSGDGELAVGNHLVDVNLAHHPQPFALGACALRGVEGEVVRCRFPIGQARHGTHQPLAVMAHAVGLRIEYHQQPVALAHGGGYAVLQARVVLICHHKLVYHYLHIVVLVAVQLHTGQGFAHLAVHTHVEVAFLAHLLEKLLVVSLTTPHQRGKDVDALSFIVFQDEVQYLLFGVLHHLLAREVGVGVAGAGIEQTQVIVHLGGSAHGGARILVGGFLLDGDNRAQSRYLVHVRTLQVPQEVAGVCRKSLDIAALPFGKDSIECQRGLAASAQSGNHRKAVTGNLGIDILKVVHARTIYIDIFCFFLHVNLSYRFNCKNNCFPPNTSRKALFFSFEMHNIIS